MKRKIFIVLLFVLVVGCKNDISTEVKYTVTHHEQLGQLGGDCRNGTIYKTWVKSESGTTRYLCGMPYQVGESLWVTERHHINYERKRIF